MLEFVVVQEAGLARAPSGSNQAALSWRPQEDDVTRYRREGWLVSPPIIEQNLLDEAWSSIKAYLAGALGRPLTTVADATDLRQSRGHPIDHLGYLALRLDPVRELVVRSGVGEIAARLSGARGVRLFHDRLIIKPPGSSDAAGVGWHTDRAYWQACTSGRMLTAWVPFQNVDARMGPLMVVAGSHRWPLNTATATAHRTDMTALLEEHAPGRPAQIRQMVMMRGQVSFHHCRVLHGSAPNRGDQARAGLAIHLQPIDNAHRIVLSPQGRMLGHTNDLLCRQTRAGRPDYRDPEIFPLLWQEGAS